jgi:DNA-binding CsgD family transcriptional regulator
VNGKRSDAWLAAQRDRRPLTPRQRQVLDLVVRGLGNKAIAAALGISEQAAKEHVSTLLRRFGATGRAALAEIGTHLQILGSTDVDVSWLPYLFVAAPIGMQVFRGPEHRIVAVNDTARRASDGDIVGLTFREAFPLNAERLVPLIDRVYATGEPHREYEFEGVWLRDGESQMSYGDFVLQPVRGADGAVSGVMLFGSDVTERVIARRLAEQISAEQLAIFDLMSEGVVVSDAKGRLLKVNEAGQRLTGLSNDGREHLDEQRRPFNLRDAAGQPVAFADIPLVRALRGETVPWMDYVLFNPVRRGDVRVRVSATPIRANDGTVVGGVVVYRPVRAE